MRTLKNEKLIELAILTSSRSVAGTEILRRLLERDVPSQEIAECKIDNSQGVMAFLPSRAKALGIKKKIDELKLKNVIVRLTELKRKQWQEKWKKDFAPFSLTPKIDVVPVWRKKDYKGKKGRIPILLDTITAFGTGLHDTTRFMSLLIGRCTGKFETFLDVGAGTGILSLVAQVYGAKNIWAIDNDPECLVVIRSNMKLNGFKFSEVKCEDIKNFKLDQTFDFVAANLVSLDLIKLKKNIYALVNPGGYLAISGISLENFPKVKKSFNTLKVSCLKVYKSKQWTAILFRRKLK